MKSVNGEAAVVVTKLRADLQDFMQYVPVITALRNPGLKDRHWASISTAVGAKVKADDSFSLSLAVSMGVMQHMAVIESVSESASKEYALEKGIEKMQVRVLAHLALAGGHPPGAHGIPAPTFPPGNTAKQRSTEYVMVCNGGVQTEWTGLVLETLEWRTTHTDILKGVDDIQILLEDHILKTQTMKGSPFIGAIEERVKLWDSKLRLVQVRHALVVGHVLARRRLIEMAKQFAKRSAEVI